jgi:hypothetical protein
MCYKARRPFSLTLCLGFLFLAFANVTKFLLERHSLMAEGPRDGLSGFLFDVAIATLMLGIWRMGRGGGVDKARCTAHSSH